MRADEICGISSLYFVGIVLAGQVPYSGDRHRVDDALAFREGRRCRSAQAAMSAYDDDRIASIGNRIAEAIDSAALGAVSWDIVPRLLVESFPKSATSINSQNFIEKKVNFQSGENLDPAYLRSYSDYYAFINPWIPLWRGVESGRVLVSEKASPARLFSRTEFYNDWLLPQGDMEAAAGMKIDGGSQEVVHIAMHYPLSMADVYDRAASAVLDRFRGNLLRAIEFRRLMKKQTEDAIAGAAVTERASCAALVVDRDCRLRDANPDGMDQLSSGSAMALRRGIVQLADHTASASFRHAVSSLSNASRTDVVRLLIRSETGSLRVSLVALPTAASSASGVFSLYPTQSMVLVLIHDPHAHKRKHTDLSGLSEQFGLTRAEVIFCEHLVRGASLVGTAERLGIAIETARTRIKAIFRKTGTHRQGELVAMLAKHH